MATTDANDLDAANSSAAVRGTKVRSEFKSKIWLLAIVAGGAFFAIMMLFWWATYTPAPPKTGTVTGTSTSIPSQAPTTYNGAPFMHNGEVITTTQAGVVRRFAGNLCSWWDGLTIARFVVEYTTDNELSEQSWSQTPKPASAYRFRSEGAEPATIRLTVTQRNDAGNCVR